MFAIVIITLNRMTEEQKKAIIESGKNYFRTSIIPNHIKNLKKLQLKDFDINPFLINYLSAFYVETQHQNQWPKLW